MERALKNNESWLKKQIREGVEIIDIGPDFERRRTQGPSLFYERERQLLDKLKYPFGEP